MCSQVFLLFGIQNPKSKSKVFNNFSRKKCLSIILNLFTASDPMVNSTVAPTVLNFRNSGVKQYRTKRPPVSWLPVLSSSLVPSFCAFSSVESIH